MSIQSDVMSRVTSVQTIAIKSRLAVIPTSRLAMVCRNCLYKESAELTDIEIAFPGQCTPVKNSILTFTCPSGDELLWNVEEDNTSWFTPGKVFKQAPLAYFDSSRKDVSSIRTLKEVL